MSNSRSRAGSLPAKSFPPKGSQRRVSPSALIKVVKMFASAPATATESSSACADDVRSPAGRGNIRGVAGVAGVAGVEVTAGG